MWLEVLLGYCKANKIWKITKSIFLNSVGQNPNINRKLPIDAADLIFSFCVEKRIYFLIN